MKAKKYFAFTRAGILDSMQWRASIFITFLGNIIYLIIIYNLWRAIYDSSPEETVNGMTFTDTMMYLVLAMSIFNMLNMWVVWEMSSSVQSGSIILQLIRPVEYRTDLLFSVLGACLMNFFMVFIPTFLIVSIITNGAIPIGFNILLFIPALLLGLLINYFIDFFVGTICLYTESTWGINMAKEVVVMLMSGAVIPLAFFPDGLRNVAEYLPFQAIYNIPLQILINNNLSFFEIAMMLGVQIFWLAVMFIVSGLFWKKSIKVITVNGG